MVYKDFTIKAKLNDFKPVEERLAVLNSKYIGLDHQTDYYFETPKGKLKLRLGTIENLITHYERVIEKDVERTIVYRYDEDPTEDQIHQLRSVCKQVGIVRKDRKIYRVDNVKIHLDTLGDGRCFIEIEAIDVSNKFSDDELKDQCLTMKARLAISDIDLVRTGYMRE